MDCESIESNRPILRMHWIHRLYQAASDEDAVTVWNCVKRIAACEISLLDFGETFYIAEDLATDIASYLVFERRLIKEWKNYNPNQAWVYISKAVMGFMWTTCKYQDVIKQTLACRAGMIGDSAYTFTGPRLRKLVRSGQLFLLADVVKQIERPEEREYLVKYLVKTMTRVIKRWPKYELLRCYLSLQEEVQHNGSK